MYKFDMANKANITVKGMTNDGIYCVNIDLSI